MASINVRVDDHVRDQLKELSDDAGVTLSEFVRDLLLEAVLPISKTDAERHGELPAPDTLRVVDRLMLSTLHRILARVLPEDANGPDGDEEYQLEKAMILEEGFVGEYWLEVAGLRTELSKRDCGRVVDILQMFRLITYSVADLAKKNVVLEADLLRSLEFRGFDHNDPLESHMAKYVKYQMREQRWTELRPQVKKHDRGNSHSRTLPVYSRMVAEHRKIMDSRERGFELYDYLLSLEELERIAAARIHPSRRPIADADDLEASEEW